MHALPLTAPRVLILATIGLAPLAPSAAGQATCQASWIPTFGKPYGLNAPVMALAGFDDGSGPALYAGGQFSAAAAGSVPAVGIAKWDGASWSALGSGMAGSVNSLTVFDDGSGPALYAGGLFTSAGGVAANRIAKWDGTSWSALGSGLNSTVNALAVFDDGSRAALFAGGQFTSAGGVAANRIARWDGTSWSALGSGADGSVEALAVFDDGSGPALFAGGQFTSAGGVAANRIAKWKGASWSALGSGMDGTVHALTEFDDGSGPALFAGGNFSSADGVPASRIAKWSGTSWSALGSGVGGAPGLVNALTVFDGGGGAALAAAGNFTSAGGVAAASVAKWDGTSWSALGSGVSGEPGLVNALTVFDDGGGAELYAGGAFISAGSAATSRIAHWDGASWSGLGSGMNGSVYSLTEFDDGSGSALFAGGNFTSAGGLKANRIAKWDGRSWSALSSGLNSSVFALTEFDDGSGSALYAGGGFVGAGGSANGIAKWDGSSWSALGSGTIDAVLSLAVFDDGSGPALYAGGNFVSVGGVSANGIAKWDGTSWSALGSGVVAAVGTFPAALALTVFDDGSGSALYAGGTFYFAGGVAANRIAKWDGTSWSALGSGMDLEVDTLTVFDDGSGPALYAGGLFTSAGGVAANRIAKWDGTSWSALGSGMIGAGVHELTVFDDGSGPALYAGGNFTSAGGVAATNVAKWNGTSWLALASGMSDDVEALTAFDDGNGTALYVGGAFGTSPGGDGFLAKWGCATIAPLQGCAGNPAALEALAPSAPLGAPLPLRITGSAAVSGLGIAVYGAFGIDGSGCGLVVPGFGELLLALAPPPQALSSGLLAGGICDLSPLVPSIPSLSGVVAYLQGAAVDAALPQPIELTNALAVELGP